MAAWGCSLGKSIGVRRNLCQIRISFPRAFFVEISAYRPRLESRKMDYLQTLEFRMASLQLKVRLLQDLRFFVETSSPEDFAAFGDEFRLGSHLLGHRPSDRASPVSSGLRQRPSPPGDRSASVLLASPDRGGAKGGDEAACLARSWPSPRFPPLPYRLPPRRSRRAVFESVDVRALFDFHEGLLRRLLLLWARRPTTRKSLCAGWP